MTVSDKNKNNTFTIQKSELKRKLPIVSERGARLPTQWFVAATITATAATTTSVAAKFNYKQ
jgi:hypothetical protein